MFSFTGLNETRLEGLVREYKRNPNYFDNGGSNLKLGVKLVRNWKGSKHVVTVTADSFEYSGLIYSSLSKVAYEVTGTRWNGWVFFGVR